MSAKFNNLKFDKIIAHEVLRASELESGRRSQQSNLFLELDPRGEDLLAKRLTDALGSESHSIEVNVEIDRDGSVFDLATKLLDAAEKDFICYSQQLTTLLTKAQTAGSIKAGIAVFLTGTMGSKADLRRFIAVLKAESDSGFQKEITSTAVLLKYISDMVLGAQQRLFKIGCFIEKQRNGGAAKDNFDVLVYDHLVSNSSSDNTAAQYFYSTFLGCKLSFNAPRLTQIFYDKTSEFINLLKLPTQERVEAKTHLISYLKSPQNTISAKEYADRYFAPSLRDGFLKWVFKDSMLPKRNIAKDISKIKNKLQVRRMIFTSKVRISAPADQFDTLVNVVKNEDGWTTVKINGDINVQT